MFTLGCDSTGKGQIERVRPTANSPSQPPVGNKQGRLKADSPSWPPAGADWDLSDWGDERNWSKAKPSRKVKTKRNQNHISISNSFQVLAEDGDPELEGVPVPHGDGGSTSTYGGSDAAQSNHFFYDEWSEDNYLVWESDNLGSAGSKDPAPTMITDEVSSITGTLKPSPDNEVSSDRGTLKPSPTNDEVSSDMGTLQTSESDNLGAAGSRGPAPTMVNKSFEHHGNLEAKVNNEDLEKHGNLEDLEDDMDRKRFMARVAAIVVKHRSDNPSLTHEYVIESVIQEEHGWISRRGRMRANRPQEDFDFSDFADEESFDLIINALVELEKASGCRLAVPFELIVNKIQHIWDGWTPRRVALLINYARTLPADSGAITILQARPDRSDQLATDKGPEDGNFERHGNLEASSDKESSTTTSSESDLPARQAKLDNESALVQGTAHWVANPALSRSPPVVLGCTPSHGRRSAPGAQGELELVREKWVALDSLD